MRNLQEAHELSYLFISHDLAVVRAMADEVIVMKEGKVVERGCTEDIFADPKDPYTQALMAAALGGTVARRCAAARLRRRRAPRAVFATRRGWTAHARGHREGLAR